MCSMYVLPIAHYVLLYNDDGVEILLGSGGCWSKTSVLMAVFWVNLALAVSSSACLYSRREGTVVDNCHRLCSCGMLQRCWFSDKKGFCCPVNDVEGTKGSSYHLTPTEKSSTGLILSSFVTRLLNEGDCFLLTGCLMSLFHSGGQMLVENLTFKWNLVNNGC